MRRSNNRSFPAVPFAIHPTPMTPDFDPDAEAALDALTERNTERNKSVLALRLHPAATAGPPHCGIDVEMNSSVGINSKPGFSRRTLRRTLRRPVARLEDFSDRDATESGYLPGSDTSRTSDGQEGDNDSDISFSSEYHGVPFDML